MPHLIVVVGVPGAGKSLFAKHFADTFNTPFINCGKIRRELFVKPTFNKSEDEIVSRIAKQMLSELLKTGKTVIYEEPSGQRAKRGALVKQAIGAGYITVFVWVQTESLTAQRRATKFSGLTADQFNAALKQFKPLQRSEKAIVISGKHTYATQVKIVLKRLTEARATVANQPLIITRRPGSYRATRR